jgi:phage-related minor tail protein
MQVIDSLPLLVSMTTHLMRMILYVVKIIATLGTIVSCMYGTNISLCTFDTIICYIRITRYTCNTVVPFA